ncbi:hypothetical protein J1N35_013453 [Gossypium stocksii]|uniref:Retrotransposon Copia-like N-terminal domain-containing protein n=1 Tax=Gossypium stocksii TaxID=47602 RepID=A0A9D4A912_9ROSI|nr:hypothetical protein J1N35_013453 [Gossypium stocksii]
MVNSTDSTSVDRSGQSSSGAWVIQTFSRHGIVKLDETNFVQWQQYIKLIIKGYKLHDFLEGILPIPPKFVASPDGSVVSEAEKVEIILAGLSSEYDSVLTLASFSTETLLFQKLGISTADTVSDMWSYGYLAQQCFYLFNRDFDGPSELSPVRFLFVSLAQNLPDDFTNRSIAFGGSGPHVVTAPAHYPGGYVSDGIGCLPDGMVRSSIGPHMTLSGPYRRPQFMSDVGTNLGHSFGHSARHGLGHE